MIFKALVQVLLVSSSFIRCVFIDLHLFPPLSENGYARPRPPTAPKPVYASKTPKASPVPPHEPLPGEIQSSGAPSNRDTPNFTSQARPPLQTAASSTFPDLPPPLPSSSPPSRFNRRRHTIAESESPSHKVDVGGGGGQPLTTISERAHLDKPMAVVAGYSPPRDIRPMKGDPVPLKTFMETRSKDLPLFIQTDIGLYGNTMHSSLVATEAMAAHFVMRTQVVRVALDRGGTYHIPCTSSNLFSVLFDPKNNIIEAMNGFYFESVADLMLHTPLPPVIRAVRSFQGASSELSVQEGDVLLVSKRIKSRGVPKRKYISCYKAGTGEKKRLHDNCTAGFTTRPEDIQLPISELLACRHTPLPLKAVMYYIGPAQDSPQVRNMITHTIDLCKHDHTCMYASS